MGKKVNAPKGEAKDVTSEATAEAKATETPEAEQAAIAREEAIARLDGLKKAFSEKSKEVRTAKRLIEKGPETIVKLQRRLEGKKDGGSIESINTRIAAYEQKIAELDGDNADMLTQATSIQEEIDRLKAELGIKQGQRKPRGDRVVDMTALRKVAFKKAMTKRGFDFGDTDEANSGEFKLSLSEAGWKLTKGDTTVAEQDYGKGSAKVVDDVMSA